jgi:hypothetical protein
MRILEVVKENKLGPDKIPDLLVVSDMQFDQANGSTFGFKRLENS